MSGPPKCPTCGTPMIQKSRPRLIVVGLGLVMASGLAMAVHWLWVPALIAFLTGVFLMVWATMGKGRWCRQCKTFKWGED